MKYTGYRNSDAIQPLRTQDKTKSEKKSGRVSNATPEFDRPSHRQQAEVSPIKKDAGANRSSHQAGSERSRLNLTPTRATTERSAKLTADSKTADREMILAHSKKGSLSIIKNVPIEKKLDSSFEKEERRIRIENFTKEFIIVSLGVIEKNQDREKRSLIEYLRKNSRICEVHWEYAIQQRGSWLKRQFLEKLQIATKKHIYRMKLIRNLARILNRPLRTHILSTLASAFSRTKLLKTPLYKPSKDNSKKAFRNSAIHTRTNTNSIVNEAGKYNDNFTQGDSVISTNTKKSEPAKSPKPKIKIDDAKLEKRETSKGQLNK